ncbi:MULTISPECIES: zinc-dependent alcohol dehydrogenase [Pseudomonas]|jgi:alcohol dehydrogenase|uniref:Alcohol dehydrogenase n=1 Tax=Pseudomonas frederiksbergensis TaxID=104087 RepID=A0A0B1Z1T0_9PSED|nr:MULTISPECIES: alcohol dehydrogenase catalytic domain-containing protein [Pseudomonas]KHK63243.1 alcohol dehydrogenase [Pseudomonas frederiksbergensis]MBI6620269.1 alcohol dehydrogenase catalytic domain-containing protein [Pseudomonas corrugata]MBI6695061.1 alcohol dehydrogenase catalytic domain-containing protein [Pseudomonas corrugata]WRV70266.1 alcohol dehydrogenase catalytic domain-containing protein [Pseudomonas frederiksbergensis]
MKELVVQHPGQLAWVNVPSPLLTSPRSALVRPIASASCDLDRRLIAGLTPFKPPFALGHECVAEVLEVGDEVTGVRRGDLVSVPWKIACGECRQCLAGRATACTAVARHAAFGVPAGGHWGGLFSEVVLVPFADAMLVPLPPGLNPLAVASASDNLTDAWVAASRPIASRPDARVLVVGGTESLGVLAVQMAVAAGAASVDYLDDNPYRLDLAQRSGANVDPGQVLDERYDVVVSATRDPQALHRGLLALAPGGHCSCIGIIFDDPKIPLFGMYLRDVTLSVGVCNVRPHIPKVFELVGSGRCDPLLVSPTIVSCEDATEALVQPLAKCIVVRERIT